MLAVRGSEGLGRGVLHHSDALCIYMCAECAAKMGLICSINQKLLMKYCVDCKEVIIFSLSLSPPEGNIVNKIGSVLVH